LARNSHEKLQECKLLNTLGMNYIEQRSLDKATHCFEQSLELARQVGELRIQARPLSNLGLAANQRGEYQKAQQYFEQALALAHQIGTRTGEGLMHANLGFLAGNLGDYTRARKHTETALRITRETGDQYAEAYCLINLSSYIGGIGEYETAIRHAREALKLTNQAGEQTGAAWALTYLGHSLFASGSYAEAGESYHSASQIRQSLNQPVLATEPLAGQARVALAQGETSLAQQYVNEILAILAQTGNLDGTDEPLRVYLTCYQALDTTNDARARSMLETAHTLLQARANQIPDESNRQLFLQKDENRLILATWNTQKSD
jgi:tetratricopeptide (TPR) repeat protein